MNRLVSYLRVYAVMLRNSLIREMNFKLNFLLWMLVEAFWFAGQLIFIEVIYSQVDAIGDWTKWDMVLLVGTHQIISQIFNAFFFTNLMNLSELVRTGKLDFVLLQPIDAQFTTSVRRFGIDSLVNAFVGILIVCYALPNLYSGSHSRPWPAALQRRSYLTDLVCGPATPSGQGGYRDRTSWRERRTRARRRQ